MTIRVQHSGKYLVDHSGLTEAAAVAKQPSGSHDNGSICVGSVALRESSLPLFVFNSVYKPDICEYNPVLSDGGSYRGCLCVTVTVSVPFPSLHCWFRLLIQLPNIHSSLILTGFIVMCNCHCVCPFPFPALLVLTPDTTPQYPFIPHSHWVSLFSFIRQMFFKSP
uniref:Uncharacterized protein n=1 Tax=Xenopus tropicalis TaxID=8364 RepID=A0A1B8XZ99_XENTR